jgi:tubulin-like protein CetZ
MTVKTEIIDLPTKIADDVFSEEVDQDKLAELKAKIAAKNKEKIMKTPDKTKKALTIGVIGTGQAGSKLGSQLYKLGYDTLAINTAAADLQLLDIPETNKLHLKAGLDGAGKDRMRGQEIAEQFADEIAQAIQKQLSECQVFLLAASLGGGSGSGSLKTLINILNTLGKPIILLAVLPLIADDKLTQANSFYALAEMTDLLKQKKLTNILVVDNAKVEGIFANVSQFEFYDVANKHIVSTLDQLNRLAAMPSRIKAVDHTELAKVLIDAEGLSVMSEMTIEGFGLTDEPEDDITIANSIINNFDNNLFVSGFDLSASKYAAFMIVANPNTWKKITSSSINYSAAALNEECQQATVFKGFYEDDLEDGIIKIYSIFSGLALPDKRVAELKKQAEEYQIMVKSKDKERNLNLSIDTGQDKPTSKVQEIKAKIAQTNSSFGKFLGNNSTNTIDRRKK